MNSILTRIGMAALLGAAIVLTGCKAGGGTDANLALIDKPEVGDIYMPPSCPSSRLDSPMIRNNPWKTPMA